MVGVWTFGLASYPTIISSSSSQCPDSRCFHMANTVCLNRGDGWGKMNIWRKIPMGVLPHQHLCCKWCSGYLGHLTPPSLRRLTALKGGRCVKMCMPTSAPMHKIYQPDRKTSFTTKILVCHSSDRKQHCWLSERTISRFWRVVTTFGTSCIPKACSLHLPPPLYIQA